jgi:chemotaxis protein CheD
MGKRIIYTMTGEVKSGNQDTVIKSGAIGSCVVITAYDKKNQLGSMAHVMLPGKAPKKKDIQKTKYAENAIANC